jgi:proteic killer suppression protein
MEILFANPELKRECESQTALRRVHGFACARKLMTRLADLLAASSLADLRGLPGECHELAGGQSGRLAITLCEDKMLVLEPVHGASSTPRTRSPDWTDIRSIRIVGVEEEQPNRRSRHRG